MARRRNPISDRRREYILSRYPWAGSILRQELAIVIPALAEIDPTKSGEYVHWLLKFYLSKNIRLPEDSDKLHELLNYFHRYKRKLPVVQRDINSYESPAELYRAVKPFYDDAAALKLPEDAELVSNRFGYKMYKLPSVKAVQKAAAGTNWCVKAKSVAAEYLEEGPLFLITTEGDEGPEKYALVHYESRQIMDVDDDPLPLTYDLRDTLRTQPNYYLAVGWLQKEDEPVAIQVMSDMIMSGKALYPLQWEWFAEHAASESSLRLFAAYCAELVLPNFESHIRSRPAWMSDPLESAPRRAIRGAQKYALGKITKAELEDLVDRAILARDSLPRILRRSDSWPVSAITAASAAVAACSNNLSDALNKAVQSMVPKFDPTTGANRETLALQQIFVRDYAGK